MKPALALLILSAALAAASPCRADLSTGLVAYYPFNGSANDASGNGNNGTPNGTMVQTTDRFGNAASAYEFNGVNSYITVPASPSLDSPTTALTQCAWILLYGTSKVGQAYDPILNKSNAPPNAFMYDFQCWPQGLDIELNWWNTWAGVAPNFNLNQWYFVAATYDGSAARFYVNGVLLGSTALAVTMPADGRPLVIGADIPGILEVFYGKIDELRIYNRALSDAEIQSLYAGSAAVNPVADAPRIAIRHIAPNPSNNACGVAFEVPREGPVELAIYDLHGRRVRTLAGETMSAGPHSAAWDGRDERGRRAEPGVYFCRLYAGGQMVSSKMVRL